MKQINTFNTSSRVANLITSVEQTPTKTTTITPNMKINRENHLSAIDECYVKSWHARVCIWTAHTNRKRPRMHAHTSCEPIYFASLNERPYTKMNRFKRIQYSNCQLIAVNQFRRFWVHTISISNSPERFTLLFSTSFGTTNTHFFLYLLHSSLSLFFNRIQTYRERARTNSSPHQWQRIYQCACGSTRMNIEYWCQDCAHTTHNIRAHTYAGESVL